MAGSVRIVGKVRFVYARCDAGASGLQGANVQVL